MAATSESELLIGRAVAPMYREPNPLTEQVSQALLGMAVIELERRGDWSHIRAPDGYVGWLPADDLVPTPPGWGPPWVEITDLWANLRAAPDFRMAAVLAAPIGVRLPLATDEPPGGAPERSGAAAGIPVTAEERWIGLLLPDGRRVWTESHRVQRVERDPLRPLDPEAVCSTAQRFLGLPYLWGGCSPFGLDCSGFVQLVLRLHGILPLRDASQQFTQGEPCDPPEAADLVFFGPPRKSPHAPKRITHVGMMLDDRRFIHAAGGDCVRIDRLSDATYASRYCGARRFVPR